MGFAILRAKKIKTVGGVNLSLKHAYRDQLTPNADPNRLSENDMMIATREEALARFNDRLSKVEGKIRKNGVLCVEYLITASPQDMLIKTREQQDKYFQDALKWIEERHGKENIITAGVHRDEKTPHLYVHVVPMDRNRNKLNCRAFLGGADTLSAMQTDFYEKVAQKHGLERGIKGSKAKHTRVRDFYKNINNREYIATFEKNRETNQRLTNIDTEPKIIGYESKFLGLAKDPIYENSAWVAERIYKENFLPVVDLNYHLKLENQRLRAQNSRFESNSYLNATGLSLTQKIVLQREIDAYLAKNKIEREVKERLEREKKTLEQAKKRSTIGNGFKI